MADEWRYSGAVGALNGNAFWLMWRWSSAALKAEHQRVTRCRWLAVRLLNCRL